MKKYPKNRAAALIIVLGLIVLIAALVIGFIARTTTERRAASSYGVAASTDQLGDMVVNVVQGQINYATRQNAKGWATQPGAIRSFDEASDTIYRLYSAKSSTTADVADLAGDIPTVANVADTLTDQFRAQWTDLNRPRYVSDANQVTRKIFPILDPRDPSNPSQILSADGFKIASAPAATTEQPAPMWVRWLYVLRDGQFVAPVANGNDVTIAGASPNNPIVGRVAYWTDDESCKININTASADYPSTTAGTFWDVPKFNASDDVDMGKYQPANGEYERYGGHPATTTLRPLLAALGISGFATQQAVSDFYKLLPRYTYDGGSLSGTVLAAGPVAKKTLPLFSSVGEMAFSFSGSRQRGPSGLTREQLEAGKFFLTANSHAPETTAFGTPRVSIWPIAQSNDAAHRGTTDQLLAFCSTINGLPYYFTRSDPQSPTTDITLSRNDSLLQYLDRLTSLKVPSYPKSLADKYGNLEKRQILTEVFDYIRCTNLRNSSVAKPYADPNPATSLESGEGQVMPSISAWGTQGFGRSHRVVEASLVFVGVGQGTNGAVPAVPVYAGQAPNYRSPSHTPPAGTIAVQAFFVVSFFDPSVGWSSINPNFYLSVKGLESLSLTAGTGGGPLAFPASGTTCINSGIKLQDGRGYGGPLDWRSTVIDGKNAKVQGTALNAFPFYSQVTELPLSASTMHLASSGPIEIQILAPDQQKVIQTYTLTFSPMDMPLPKLSNYRLFGANDSTAAAQGVLDRFTVAFSSDYKDKALDKDNDVIYSMVPSLAYADTRLFVSGTLTEAFSPHPKAGGQFACTLFSPTEYYNTTFGTQGSLISDPAMNTFLKANAVQPYAAATLNGAYVGGGNSGVAGDWDNAFGKIADGPYINKPDEGNMYNSVASPYFGAGATYTSENAGAGATYYSPNRQVSSPVMFGSLPTGVIAGKGWQTLLFRPGPSGHPGANSPADHVLLDLFWMPVVEPYAISEPFATGGKVNMNSQILPFSYIERSTALRAALASEKVAAVASSDYKKYKVGVMPTARYALNLSDTDGTMRQFKEKFAQNGYFKTASEICNIYLVPNGQAWLSDSAASMAWYGAAFALVGDNTREKPYSDLYSRLTTRSNTFKIHYTVQSLKNTGLNSGTWNETKGQVRGELRGSTIIERYLDVKDSNIPDYATNSGAQSLDNYYRWRIISSDKN